MFVLGIAPGLGALAYSVLQVSQPSAHGAGEVAIVTLDSDVLHTGKRLDVATAWEIARRCKAHHMLLEIVMRRNPPNVIAIGPAVDGKEPEDQVLAVRLLILAIGRGLGLTVRDFSERQELAEALGSTERGLVRTVRERLNGAAPRDRRMLMASAAALAAMARR